MFFSNLAIGKCLYVMVRRLPNRFIGEHSGYFMCLCVCGVLVCGCICTSNCERFHS